MDCSSAGAAVVGAAVVGEGGGGRRGGAESGGDEGGEETLQEDSKLLSLLQVGVHSRYRSQ